MAKATATCTCKHCGKTFEKITTKANRREADRWEEWAKTYFDECESCFKARMAQEREAENAAAAEKSAENGWAVLTGSEKQVAWANTLRIDYIKRIDEKIAASSEKGAEPYRQMREFILKTYTEAKFWIDNRNDYYMLDKRVVKDYRAAQGAGK